MRSLTGVLLSLRYHHIRGTLLVRSLTIVLLRIMYYRTQAPSGEITHRCSAKFKISSHPRHLLVEITHRCSAKFKISSHPRHLLLRSLTGVLLSLRYHHIRGTFTVVLLRIMYYRTQAPSGEITHRCSAKINVILHPRHHLVRSLTGVLLSLRYHHIRGTFW